jgi:hypothetical protein
VPQIPEAIKQRAPRVTTHQVDDHDAPGGSDLEAQLLREADPGAPRVGGAGGAPHVADVPLEYQGLRFPAQPGHAPPTAQVYRREPVTAPEVSLEIPPDASTRNYGTEVHVNPDPRELAPAAPDQHPQLGYALLNFPVQLNQTSPVLVLPMELAPTSGGIRRAITVLNNGTVGAFLAGSLEGCTAAFGFPLAAGAAIILEQGVSGQLFALGNGAATELRVLVEQGPPAARGDSQPELAEICRLLRRLAGES